MEQKHESNKKGFTLIELLVVVIITAVLAAIALPKYFTVVKLTKVKTTLASLAPIIKANNNYLLVSGQYTPDIDKLDVSIPYESKRTEDEDGETSTVFTTSWGRFNVRDNSDISVRFNDVMGNAHITLFNPSAAREDGLDGYDGKCMVPDPKDKEELTVCAQLGTLLNNASGKQYGIKL